MLRGACLTLSHVCQTALQFLHKMHSTLYATMSLLKVIYVACAWVIAVASAQTCYYFRIRKKGRDALLRTLNDCFSLAAVCHHSMYM